MNIISESAHSLSLIAIFGFCMILILASKQRVAMAQEETYDHSAIQNQIDAIRDKGGIVKLEARTYIVRQAIVLYNNVAIEGAAIDKTIIRLADNANPQPVDGRIPFVNRCIIRNENYDELAAPQGNYDITIRNLTIDGNAQSNTFCGEGILLPNCYDYRIENVHVGNCRGYAGIYTNPCHLAARNKVQYRNYILNCIVENQQPATDRDAPYGHGFYVTAQDNDNVLLKGCIARNNVGSGIHGEDFISRFFVEENEAYGNGGSGIWFCEVRNSVIRKNKSHHNAGDGIAISQGKGNRSNMVYGNEVHHNGNNGISVVRQYAPGDSLCSIMNNRIWNNEHAAIFIADSATGNTIAFNLCYDNRDADDHTQKYGIFIDSSDNIIVNNYIAGNAREATIIVDGNTVIEWKPNAPLEIEEFWQIFELEAKKASE